MSRFVDNGTEVARLLATRPAVCWTAGRAPEISSRPDALRGWRTASLTSVRLVRDTELWSLRGGRVAGMTGDLVGSGEAERFVAPATLREMACLPIPAPNVGAEVPFTIFTVLDWIPPLVRTAGREVAVEAGTGGRLEIGCSDQDASGTRCIPPEEVRTLRVVRVGIAGVCTFTVSEALALELRAVAMGRGDLVVLDATATLGRTA